MQFTSILAIFTLAASVYASGPCAGPCWDYGSSKRSVGLTSKPRAWISGTMSRIDDAPVAVREAAAEEVEAEIEDN